MRVGFIGLGLIGARRAKIVEPLGHSIAFVLDPDEKRLASFDDADRTSARSLGELSKKGFAPVDAIFVAVPHDLAVEACCWAFSQNAHVLCEKPMGRNPREAKIIADAARSSGKRFCAGFNYRYLPGVSALRSVIGDHRLGRIFRVRMAMGHGGRPGMENEWKLKLARAGGGALIDPGIHLVDLSRHLFGAGLVRGVSLRRCYWNTDVEDNCALTLTTPGGDIEVAIDVSLTSWTNQFSIEVQGSDGMAQLTGRGGNYGAQRLEYVNRWFWQGEDKKFVTDLGTADPSFELETCAFLDAVGAARDDGILSDLEAGSRALDIVQSAYEKNAS